MLQFRDFYTTARLSCRGELLGSARYYRLGW